MRFKRNGRSVRLDPYKASGKWTILTNPDELRNLVTCAVHVETIPHTCHLEDPEKVKAELLLCRDMHEAERTYTQSVELNHFRCDCVNKLAQLG